MGAIMFPWHHLVGAEENTTIPPAQVIVNQAVVVDQGVEVSWLTGQPGDHPISGYSIERSRQGGDFSLVGHVKESSISYVDAEGQAGNVYRVIAEDDQQPSNHSVPSEGVTAAAAKPGDAIVVAPAAPEPTQQSPSDTLLPLSQTPPSEVAVMGLQNLTMQAANALDGAISSRNTSSTNSALDTLQGYHSQILSAFPRLSLSQKTSLAQSCDQQVSLLEPDLHILPENAHMDGLLVLAGCDAIKDALQ
jgi:hypothetical protein